MKRSRSSAVRSFATSLVLASLTGTLASPALAAPILPDPWPEYYPYTSSTDSLPITTYTDWNMPSSTSMALGFHRDVHVVLVTPPDSLHPTQRLEYIRFYPDKDSLAERRILYTATDSQLINSPDIAIGEDGMAMVAFLLDRGCSNCSVFSTGETAVMSIDPSTGSVLKVSTNPTDPRSQVRGDYDAGLSRPQVAWIRGVPTIVFEAQGKASYDKFLAAATPTSSGWSVRKAIDPKPAGSFSLSRFTVARNATTLLAAGTMSSDASAQCVFQEGGRRFCTPSAYNGFLRNDRPSVAQLSSGPVYLFWGDDRVIAASGSAVDSGGVRELRWNPADTVATILTYGRWRGNRNHPIVSTLDPKTGLGAFFYKTTGPTGTIFTRSPNADTLSSHLIQSLGYAEGDVAMEARDSFVALVTIKSNRLYITTLSDSVRFVPPSAASRHLARILQVKIHGHRLSVPELAAPADVAIFDLQGRQVFFRRMTPGKRQELALPPSLRGTVLATLRDADGGLMAHGRAVFP